MSSDKTASDGEPIAIKVPETTEVFDGLMYELGSLYRAIETLSLECNAAVAEIDKTYNEKRQPLVAQYNTIFDACMEFVSNTANKARMTTAKAPQTADLPHSKVKWKDIRTSKIELAEGINEAAAIRALLHRKGGSKYVITTRKLNLDALSADGGKFALTLRHFVQRFNLTTSVSLHIKPASTPKPDGKAAETQVKRLS